MAFLCFATLCAVGIALLLPTNPSPKNDSDVLEYPRPEIREEQSMVVGGVTETWQLRWVTPPKQVCGASEVSVAITCPCIGFAYGEGGDLDLVRLRNGSEIDRLHITPLFEEQFSGTGRVAIIPRWPVDDGRDLEAGEEDLSETIAKRPTVQVIHFFDYNHDGDATEFYLQTDSLACGKSLGVVIGISKTNPRLHVFGTASNPSKPLYLQKHEWEALRDAAGVTEVLDWECGDHGNDVRTRVRLVWTPDGIEGVRRSFECTPEGKPGKLLSEEPL